MFQTHFFLEVLAVAGWILLTDLLLAEPSRILQTASFFWNIHHHVHGHPQDYIQIFCCSIGFYHCIWIRISHCICKPGKTLTLWKLKSPYRKRGKIREGKISNPVYSGHFISLEPVQQQQLRPTLNIFVYSPEFQSITLNLQFQTLI